MDVCVRLCVSALVCLKLDAWKLPLLCELNSRWAGVWVCVCICRVKGLSGPGVYVFLCVSACVRVDERLLVDLAFRWPPGCFAVWSACPRFCWGLERRSPSFPCCNTSVCTQANKHTWKINSLKQYREFSGLREKNRIIKLFPSCSSFNCLVCSLA